jgi:glycine/D-amino acid oxidase-like deaminating enzyme/nitrite reductase/ring-hydroxylating ferredoxin subunit
MNVADEASRSCWMDAMPEVAAPPLAGKAECDLVVIGSGIAGLSSAYEAARFGKRVVVIDRGRICGGMTSRTTAHLATEIDDFYSELIRARGEEKARLYHESQVAAVNRVEAICADEGIEADFARLDGYLVAATPDHQRDLEEEYEACRRLEVAVEWTDSAPVPMPKGTRALRFPDQGRFHPLKYCAGLIRAIEARGGRFHADTSYAGHREDQEGVTVECGNGAIIRASAALFATNSPVNDKVTIHTKQVPMRTYAIAGRVPKGSAQDALVWDSLEAYHYCRIQPLDDASDLLIVGGEDHQTGTANDMAERFERLEAWTRDHYPSFRKSDYRWSGQVLEPVDFLPYSGLNPGNLRIYIHSGDSGMGMTNGIAGSLNFIALLTGEKARFAELFDPGRKPVSAIALKEFVAGQAEVVANLSEYATPGEVDSADAIRPGDGAIVRRGLRKIAAYRDKSGALTERSAVCTHVGCIVHWNSLEKCWDCPCHGSQFAIDGSVLNGPAIRPLAMVDQPAETETA